MIERFLHQRMDSGCAPKTAIVDVKTLSSALARAERLGYIDRNPARAVTLPKSISSEREPFTLAEVEELVAAAPNLDWQTLILLASCTGARLGDCVSFTWDHLNLETAQLLFIQQKTNTAVMVPLHPRLISHLKHLSLTFTEGPLCRSLSTKGPGGKHGLSEGFKRIVKRAGLDLMVVKGKGARNFSRRTFHSLRHGFASVLANLGTVEEVRRALTGHKDSEIHRKYTHLSDERLRAAIMGIKFPTKPTPNSNAVQR